MRLEKLPELKQEHKKRIKELIKERKEELLEFAEDIYTEYAYYALIDTFDLTDQEADILKLQLKEGYSREQVSEKLDLSIADVEALEKDVCDKMGVETMKDVDMIVSNYYLAIMVKISNYFFELLDENV